MPSPEDVRPRLPISVWIAGTIDEVTAAAASGLVDAIVTNPTVVARWCEGGRTLGEVVREVVHRSDVPLFVQLRGPRRDAMLEEAAALRAISPRVLPKLPATPDGLQATRRLSDAGVPTLVTTVCTARQAAMFAVAGASYPCPYFSRLNDVGGDAAGLVRAVSQRFRWDGVPTRVFPASVRTAEQAEEAWLAGADGVIVFWDVFRACSTTRRRAPPSTASSATTGRESPAPSHAAGGRGRLPGGASRAGAGPGGHDRPRLKGRHV